jgi:hypothetical protein
MKSLTMWAALRRLLAPATNFWLATRVPVWILIRSHSISSSPAAAAVTRPTTT